MEVDFESLMIEGQ